MSQLEKIVKDSPLFHASIKTEVKNSIEYRNKLQDVVNAASKYYAASLKFTEEGQRFTKVLEEFAREEVLKANDNDPDKDLAISLDSFGRSYAALLDLFELSLGQLKPLFIDPIQELITQDLDLVRPMYKKFEKEKSEKDLIHSKYVTGVIEEKTFLNSLKRYYSLFFDLVSNLNSIREKKKFEVIERTYATLLSMDSLFREGLEVIRDCKDPGIVMKLEEFMKRMEERNKRNEENRNQLMRLYRMKLRGGSYSNGYKEGYLYDKKAGKLGYYVVDGYNFYQLVQSQFGVSGESLGNLMLCSASMLRDSGKTGNGFTFYTQEKKTVYLAETEEIAAEWIEAIQKSIKRALDGQTKEISIRPELLFYDESGGDVALQNMGGILRDLYDADPENRKCADCGRENPTWVSLNIGCVVCLDCAGAHRSLGAQISRVRSLDLDTLSEEAEGLLLNLGNRKVNYIYEKYLPEGVKPSPTSDMAVKKKFISEKYVKRTWQMKLTGPQKKFRVALMKAVRTNNFPGVYLFLSLGISPDFEYAGDTPLSLAVTMGNLPIIEILINYSDLNFVFDKNQTILHRCYKLDKYDTAKRLMEMGASVLKTSPNSGFVSVLDIARRDKNEKYISLFSGRGESSAPEEPPATTEAPPPVAEILPPKEISRRMAIRAVRDDASRRASVSYTSRRSAVPKDPPTERTSFDASKRKADTTEEKEEETLSVIQESLAVLGEDGKYRLRAKEGAVPNPPVYEPVLKQSGERFLDDLSAKKARKILRDYRGAVAACEHLDKLRDMVQKE